MKIQIEVTKFKAYFPALAKQYESDEALELAISAAYDGVDSFISTELGEINLAPNLQTRGVYLAVAHIMALSLDDGNGNGGGTDFRPIASVSQGSESVSFVQVPNNDGNLAISYLQTTKYGMELLVILQQVQPLPIDTPLNVDYYY